MSFDPPPEAPVPSFESRAARSQASWGRICFTPGEFFGEGALPTRVPMVPFYVAVHGLAGFAGGVTEAALEGESLLSSRVWVALGISVFSGLAQLVIVGALLWVVARWFGGRATLASSFQAFGYSAAPLLLTAIPVAGVLGIVWWLVVLTIAIARVNGLSKGRSVVVMVATVFIPTFASVALALAVRFLAMEAFSIPSAGMYPTFVVGDHVMANKLAFGVFTKRAPAHGDPIVFTYPDPDPTNARTDFIKRVVGLPGDQVAMQRGNLIVNGWRVPRCQLGPSPDPEHPGQDYDLSVEFLRETAYLVATTPDAQMESSRAWFVAKDELFVMGDNRDNSADSRAWAGGRGAGVPLANVIGRPSFIWFPFERFRSVPTPTLPLDSPPALQVALTKCLASAPSMTEPPPPSAAP
jgi:signal peptidase I